MTPQWLLDSIEHDRPMPCGDYVAVNDLYDETIKNCPLTDRSDSGSLSRSPTSRPSSPTPQVSPPTAVGTTKETDTSKISYKSRFSCARTSPLICPNQELAEQFDLVRRARELDGEIISAENYARAVSVCDPHSFVSFARRLPNTIRLGDQRFSQRVHYFSGRSCFLF